MSERVNEQPWRDEWGNTGMEFTYVGEQPPRYVLRVENPEDGFVVGIKSTGEVEFGAAFKPPWRHRRAARQFWKQVAGLCGLSAPLESGGVEG